MAHKLIGNIRQSFSYHKFLRQRFTATYIPRWPFCPSRWFYQFYCVQYFTEKIPQLRSSAAVRPHPIPSANRWKYAMTFKTVYGPTCKLVLVRLTHPPLLVNYVLWYVLGFKNSINTSFLVIF